MSGQDAERRARIVAEARLWIGTPYRHQASVRDVGCDCLGLIRGVWRAVVGAEPETAGPYSPQWAEATGVERLAAAAFRHFVPIATQAVQAGDVLLFRWRPGVPAKHLGIATSANTMVHAQDGACVCEVSLSPWWRRRLAFAFAFPTRNA